jgi:hypothetical protein
MDYKRQHVSMMALVSANEKLSALLEVLSRSQNTLD